LQDACCGFGEAKIGQGGQFTVAAKIENEGVQQADLRTCRLSVGLRIL
jgi:hypothetical protein